MKKQNRRDRLGLSTQPVSSTVPADAGGGMQAFTFGDPEAVLDKREIFDYLECMKIGEKWYEPPVSWSGLAKTFRAAPHHSSPLYLKRNILASAFIPHKLLSRSTFSALALDYMVFGNAYPRRQLSRIGTKMPIERQPAKYMRRGLKPGQFWYVPGYNQELEFSEGEIFQLMEPDIDQEIYGLPEYLSALNSTWLNESATLFRRRYYKNGSHAGFILYMTDAAQKESDIDDLRQALKDSKGPGNFRNLMVYAPNGKKEGIQLIPVAEVAAKDEFFNIKNITRDDMLAAHRVPPQLMSIIPNNTGGFGDAGKAAAVFARNELVPLQTRMEEINEWFGEQVVAFEPYEVGIPATDSKSG